MIPTKTIEELIIKHSTLEKDLSSGSLDNKIFAEKSKEYSDVNEIILNAKKYLSFENERQELEKILEDNSSDKELKNMAELELVDLKSQHVEISNQQVLTQPYFLTLYLMSYPLIFSLILVFHFQMINIF